MSVLEKYLPLRDVSNKVFSIGYQNYTAGYSCTIKYAYFINLHSFFEWQYILVFVEYHACIHLWIHHLNGRHRFEQTKPEMGGIHYFTWPLTQTRNEMGKNLLSWNKRRLENLGYPPFYSDIILDKYDENIRIPIFRIIYFPCLLFSYTPCFNTMAIRI